MVNNLKNQVLTRENYDEYFSLFPRMRKYLLNAGNFCIIGGSFLLIVTLLMFRDGSKQVIGALFFGGLLSLLISLLRIGRPLYLGDRFSSTVPEKLNKFEFALKNTMLHFRRRLIIITLISPYFLLITYQFITNTNTKVETTGNLLIAALFALLSVGGICYAILYYQIALSLKQEIKNKDHT
jgi:hypothetical protein